MRERCPACLVVTNLHTAPPAYLSSRSYEAVQPLHRSWQQYMQELLAGAGSTPGPSSARGAGGGSSNDVEARLYAADLHGCLIRVSHTAGGCCRGPLFIVGRRIRGSLSLRRWHACVSPRHQPACLACTPTPQTRATAACKALWCVTPPTRCSWSRQRTALWLYPSRWAAQQLFAAALQRRRASTLAFGMGVLESGSRSACCTAWHMCPQHHPAALLLHPSPPTAAPCAPTATPGCSCAPGSLTPTGGGWSPC